MLLGVWTRVGPRNHVLDRVQIQYEAAILRGGEVADNGKVQRPLPWVAQKRLKQSRYSLGWWVGWVHGVQFPPREWAFLRMSHWLRSTVKHRFRRLVKGLSMQNGQTDLSDLYIVWRASLEGCAFWGAVDNAVHLVGQIPKTVILQRE